MIAVLLFQQALAQSCSCAVGNTDSVLPTGTLLGAGRVQLGLDFGMGQTGGEPWEGVVPAADRKGNSMPDMAMPGHLVQSFRSSGIIGFSKGFAAMASVPYVRSAPLYPSDMRGDVRRGFLGDVALGGQWGSRKGPQFFGTGLGLVLPTGKMTAGSGVRGGRGAMGLTLDGSALRLLTPTFGVAGRVAWTQSLYASAGGYTVGPQLDVALGARWWPQEEGPLSVYTLAAGLHRGHDRSGTTVLDQTGMQVLSAGLGTDWRIWSEHTRAMMLSLRGQVPLVQVVGDPWLAENWSLAGSFAVGF